MICIFALVSFVDEGTETGLYGESGCDAGTYATPFTQYARYVLKGNFTSTAGTAYLMNGTATLNLTSLPGGASIVAAYLFWTGQTNTLNEFANIRFAGNPITGTVIAYDCSDCWGTSYNSLYVCNVTAYVNGNGSYVASDFPSLGNSVPGVNGFTLLVVYLDPTPTVTRVVSIWTGDIDLQGCGPTYTSWVQTGLQASNPIIDARAALTISECQDNIPSFALFNGNFVAYFDGTNPGNHYGHWEGNCATWMSGGATQATWYVERACGAGCDCIAPVVSVISVTADDPAGAEESAVTVDQRPFVAGVVSGGIRLVGFPGSTIRLSLYDATGRSAYTGNLRFSEDGTVLLPASQGVWFMAADRYGPIGKVVVW